MKKLPLLFAIIFTLIICFLYYMLTDDELSEDAKYWIEQAQPAQNLENNVFIHLMALGDTRKGAYESHKRNYLEKFTATYSQHLEMNDRATFPIQLIKEGELPSEMYCLIGEDKCLDEIRKNESFLRESLEARMLVVKEFIESSVGFDYKQLDSQSSMGNFEGLYAFNYLASLYVYLDILDGNTQRAEQTLFQHFALLRKLAENSLDLVSTVTFVISIEQLFQPLVEILVSSGHKFDNQSLEQFSGLSMREVSLQKVAISEFAFMHRAAVNVNLNLHNFVEGKLSNEWVKTIGYKPIATLNMSAAFWKEKTVPENTLKKHYLAANKATEAATVKRGKIDLFSIILSNPRNFIGELLLQAATPRFLNISYSYAATDLNLLLFKMLIKSQSTSVEKLINNIEFEDPYTGNMPYLSGSKVCYPAWKELDTKEQKQQPVCINVSTPDVH